MPHSYEITISDGLTGTLSYQQQFSNSGFEITADHLRSGCCQSSQDVASTDGDIYFSVDADVNYTAIGSYSAVDVGSAAGTVHLDSFLFDYTDSVYVFQSRQSSDSTLHESFSLGGVAGDLENIKEGSLIGTLMSGHSYRFHYLMFVRGINSGGVASPVTATGAISLAFSPIPELGTALLVSLGLIGMAANRKPATLTISR